MGCGSTVPALTPFSVTMQKAWLAEMAVGNGRESADKPGFVVDNHSSRTSVTTGLKRPTRTRRGPRLKGPYLVLLRVGFSIAVECYHPRGALLPHHFNLTGIRRCLGGILSVALSVGSRRPDVIWHLAQWSPDFPPPLKSGGDCLADSRRAV